MSRIGVVEDAAMPSRLVRCATLAPTPYAYAAVAGPGTRTVHLAGACPLDVDGRPYPDQLVEIEAVAAIGG